MSNISQNFLSDVKMTDFNLDSTRPSWEVLEMPGILGLQSHPSLGPNMVEGGSGGVEGFGRGNFWTGPSPGDPAHIWGLSGSTWRSLLGSLRHMGKVVKSQVLGEGWRLNDAHGGTCALQDVPNDEAWPGGRDQRPLTPRVIS